jgi:hypothetical protein
MSQPPSSTDLAEGLALRSLSDVLPPPATGLLTKLAVASVGVNYVRQAKNILAETDGNPIALATALDFATQRDWRDWEPETMRDLLDLGEDDVRQLDLVMATQVALTNPDVFEDWTLFHHVCVVFNHRRANFEWLDAQTVLEAAWACCVLRALNARESFGPGILRYLTGVCMEQGLLFFPWTGGEGMSVPDMPWSPKDMQGALTTLAHEVRTIWQAGTLAGLEPMETDADNPLHAQLAQIIKAQAYLRSQMPRSPEDYT